MKVKGYKFNGYDATYRKALFNVCEKGQGEAGRVLEITDVESGETFMLELEFELNKNGNTDRIRSWREKEVQGQGLSIVFGDKGLFQQLKYGGRKIKNDIDK